MDRILFLLSRYLTNEATADEISEMLELLRRHDQGEELLRRAWEQFSAATPEMYSDPERFSATTEAHRAAIWKQVEAATRPPAAYPTIPQHPVAHPSGHGHAPAMVEGVAPADPHGHPPARIRPLWRYGWAAAILVLLVSGAIYFELQDNRQPPVVAGTTPIAADITPGRDGAILQLADGRQVVLDSLQNGIVAVQNGTRVMLQEGQLVYGAAENTPEGMVYNTMITPKGRQFNMVLPDGTRVWMNAASSLRYPTVFAGKERRVELTGEAYFEVAKDRSKPFFVTISGQAEVEALGTAFNVNAYNNESIIHTTLLEGSVRVKSKEGVSPAVLKPGQQARITGTAGVSAHPPAITVVSDSDIDKVMAWKNGTFNFDNAGLSEVMKQLERWYDLEVVYEKGIPDIKFGGEMSRNVTLSSLLQALSEFRVHFRLEEGRRLVVMP